MKKIILIILLATMTACTVSPAYTQTIEYQTKGYNKEIAPRGYCNILNRRYSPNEVQFIEITKLRTGEIFSVEELDCLFRVKDTKELVIIRQDFVAKIVTSFKVCICVDKVIPTSREIILYRKY